MSTLEIKGLCASVDTKEGRKSILKGVDLTIESGQTHAIMGPNGSGKSTLAYTLAGHPKYQVDSGSVLLATLIGLTPIGISPFSATPSECPYSIAAWS